MSADEKWKLDDTQILKAVACAHPKYFLGARAGKFTRFAVLDIDARSRHHNKKELHRLMAAVTETGLTEPAAYRSSDSNGWHLYIFFDQPVPSKEVHSILTEYLKMSGFTVQKGSLEVFPAPGVNSLGCGLRLPLQPGWAWLNPNSLEIDCEREWLSADQAIESFMADCDRLSNSLDEYIQFKQYVSRKAQERQQLDEQIKRTSAVIPIDRRQLDQSDASIFEIFGAWPPGLNSETWWRGRHYFENGLTGPGQRADAIFCLGHYLFYGDPDRTLEPLGYGYEEQRRYAIESILAAKNHNQSRDLNRGRADAIKQVARCTGWLPEHRRDSYVIPYKKEVPIAWVRNNANLKADAIKRIKTALEEYVQNNQPFTAEELAAKAGCAKSTLYKHKDLWKALQLTLYERLTGRSDEYNAVEAAAPPQSGCQPHSYAKDMPPGRLAARRIAFELSRRSKKDQAVYPVDMKPLSERHADMWSDRVARLIPDETRSHNPLTQPDSKLCQLSKNEMARFSTNRCRGNFDPSQESLCEPLSDQDEIDPGKDPGQKPNRLFESVLVPPGCLPGGGSPQPAPGCRQDCAALPTPRLRPDGNDPGRNGNDHLQGHAGTSHIKPKSTPDHFGMDDGIKDLRARLAVILSLIAQAPDEEHQMRLQGQARKLRDELAEMAAGRGPEAVEEELSAVAKMVLIDPLMFY